MGASKIKGLTIEIGGETTGLDRALSGVNSKSKDLQSELREVEKLLKLDPSNVELAAQKQQLLGQAVQAAKEKLDTLKTAAEQASQKLANGEIGEDQYRALQREVIKAEQNLNSLEKQADQSGDELQEAGNKAKESGDDAEKGKSGWGNLKDGLAAVGAVALSAVAALGAAAAAAGAALVAASVSGAAYADDVMTVSTQTGIATDKLQGYMYAAELVDVSTETMTKSMGKNIKSMKAVQDGTKLSVDAYNRLGVSVLNADGSLRDGQTVYWETIDALGRMENETERDALAMQVLGKSAQELNPLIEAGSERMLELAAKAQEAGYILSEDTLEAFGELDDQLQYLKVGAEAAKNALGTILLPMLTELAGDGTELLGQFTNGLLDANGDIGKIGTTIGTTLSSLVNKIVERLPQVIEAGMAIIGALGQGLMDNLPAIISAAVEIITMLASGLVKALPQIVAAALQIIVALALGIADALPELIPAIVDTVLMIVDTLIDNIDMLIDAAIAIMVGLAEGLIDALPKLIEKVPQIVIKLVSAIIENAPKLLAASVALVGQLATGLASSFGGLLSQVGGWIDANILQPIKDKFADIKEIGSNLIKGLWEGIQSASRWISDKVSGFIAGIKALFTGKDGFDVHSPSRWGKQIGANTSKGVSMGMLEGLATLAKNVKKNVADIKASFSPLDGGFGSLENSVNYAAAPTSASLGAPGASIQDSVAAAIAAGLAAIGDVIYEAIPKTTVLNLNGRQFATVAWDDFDEVARDKSLIFAASREAITNIARSVT